MSATWLERTSLYRKVRRNILARSGPAARLVRRGLRPFRRREILAVAREAGLGDVLMTTPMFREAKRRNPELRTVLYTTNELAPLVRQLPYIDEVLPYDMRPADVLYVGYEDAIAPRAPLPQIFADWIGLRLDNLVPDCVVDTERVTRFVSDWAAFPQPHIVVLRRASRWTPNKDWPGQNWISLLEKLCQAATIIEIGVADPKVAPFSHRHYIDLRGRTSIEDLPAVICAASLHIGPVSGPMHIAAAVGTPSVTICGGYEHPRGIPYPNNQVFYTPVACAPCWLPTHCPHNLACLTAITVTDVEAAVWKMLNSTKGFARVSSFG